MIPIDSMLYFYLMVGMRLMESPVEIKHSQIIKPYTTSHIITNNDMYNVNDICEQILIDQVNNDEDSQ